MHFLPPSCLQNINPLIAKKMTEDRGREYGNAKRVAKEYEAVTRGLNKNLASVPPQNSPEEATQVSKNLPLVPLKKFPVGALQNASEEV